MANLKSCTLLICFVFISIEAARVQTKPVYERISDNADYRGNPLVADSKNELTQRARVHIQNQQRRYNMEKTRKHKALMEHAQSQRGETMDSYLKAFQEQQDNYQRDVERKVSLESSTRKQDSATIESSKSLKDYPNSQWWKSDRQIRNKRVNADTSDFYKSMASKRAISHKEVRNTPYVLSPNYYYAPSENQNHYASYEPIQTFKTEEEKSSLHHAQPYDQLTHYKTNGDLQSLNALLGKDPRDQLRGFNELLNNQKYSLSPNYYDNPRVNLKASSLDVQHEGQATEYVFQNSYQADEAAQQQYAYNYKDHTPITENVNDVADTRSPVTVKYVYPTETPLSHTSSNYYKVEVANHVVSEHPKSEGKYLNLDTSDHDNTDLHYASQYEFGYRVRDPHSGNDFGHKEVSDGKSTKGQYHVLLPDGRLQKVSYVAGPSGYHARVSYQ